MQTNDYTKLTVGRKYPFYPLTSEDMPLPGPDFIEHAAALSGKESIKLKKGESKKLLECTDSLSDLYYRALYEPNFSVNIGLKGRKVSTTLIRGHLWGGQVTGPRPAKVMVIGKWPGVDELKSARNMIGPSGQITMRALEDANVTKETYDRWYVTNLVKHTNLDPANNKLVGTWLKNCLPLLEEELRLVRPDFILVLGKDAAKQLISDDFKFELSAGQVFTRQIRINLDGEPAQFKEAKIMACVHPANVLRAADRMPEFKQTIKRFVQLTCNQPFTIEEEQVEHHVVTTEEQLKALVDDILANETGEEQPIIAIDSEWHGEYPAEPGSYLRTIQFSHKAGFAACIVLRGVSGVEVFKPSLSSPILQLKRLLVSSDKRKVRIAGHHLRADLPWIMHYDKELGQALLRQYDGPETPEQTRTEGGFDTMLAAHAVTEAPGKMGFKLEILALGVCGVRRYDIELQKWKKRYCNDNNMSSDDLEGYGECPDDVLYPYACYDADATRRLVDAYNRPGGLLDSDQFGQSCREAFWESMRASPACLEMEMTGLAVDRKRGEELTELYSQAKIDLTDQLRQMINWPKFNPNSTPQCRTLLFGPKIANVFDKKTNTIKDISPSGSRLLNIEPIKTSGKPAKQWDVVLRRKETHLYSPSTDKEVLGILLARYHGRPEFPVVNTLRNVRFAGQVIKSVLRPPKNDEDGVPERDDDDDLVFDKGLLGSLLSDNRLHTHIFQTLETGRFSSARPPVQNLGKKREREYKELLGTKYKYPLRSMITTSPGHVLVEADYVGAELFMMAIQSGDALMIEHCSRAMLPSGHPDYYDIHSNIAVKAFKLKCAPTKKALEEIGRENLRVAAKTIAFGLPYGRGIQAVVRAVEEEGVKLSIAEGEAVRWAILDQYSRLEPYLEGAAARVASPCWIANCFRRYRRFQQTGVKDNGELERQAKNFCIQSGVASAVNRALKHLYNRNDRYNGNGELRYRIVLQIHDAILLEVRIEDVEWVVDKVLPWAMTDMVSIKQCDYNGDPVPSTEVYNMGVETSVYLNWGLHIPEDAGQALGIPARFCDKHK